MKTVKLTFLILTIVLFGLGAEPEIILKNQVTQGQVLSVLVRDNSAFNTVKAELTMEDQIIARASGFTPFPVEGGVYTTVLLLGISSTQKIGKSELILDVVTSRGSARLTREVDILPGDFIREDIPLTSSLSDLRQSDDPEKARQSQALYDLLLIVNPDHVFLKSPLKLPLEGARRTSYFGDRRRFLYTDGNESRSIHFGIDFSANPGTPVYSDGAGLVVFSGDRILTGNTVVVEHLPGVYSLYYHMKERYLLTGEIVEAGTPVGTVGATGLATGAHLHWEIRVNGVPVAPDPLTKSALLDKDSFMDIVKGL